MRPLTNVLIFISLTACGPISLLRRISGLSGCLKHQRALDVLNTLTV